MTRTLSVKLPDGTTATRQTERQYKYAILFVRTAEMVRLRLAEQDAHIANQQAIIQTLEGRADDADRLAWSEARAECDYLEEKVIENDRDGRPYEVHRWLSNEYRQSIGEKDGQCYREEPSALNNKQRASGKLYATATQRLMDERSSLASRIMHRANIAATIVRIDGRAGGTVEEAMDVYPEGCCSAENWSTTRANAQKMADDIRVANPGASIRVLDEITEHVTTKSDKPRKAPRVHLLVPVPLQRHASTIACTGKTWGKSVRAVRDHSKVTCPECLGLIDESETARAGKEMM